MSKKKKVVGTTERPRLVVYRSLRYMHAQIVDDTTNTVLVGLMNKTKDVSAQVEKAKTKTEAASIIGKLIAEKAKKKKIETVIFDRNGYLYHGRVKALADGAREGGLKF